MNTTCPLCNKDIKLRDGIMPKHMRRRVIGTSDSGGWCKGSERQWQSVRDEFDAAKTAYMNGLRAR